MIAKMRVSLCGILSLLAYAAHASVGIIRGQSPSPPPIRSSSPIAYNESWAYVNVRAHAHMFYWLMQRTDIAADPNRPLLIWLQGGPGASSTGFGNFEEIGPVDASGKRRAYSWLNQADLVFIDNPVGAGFSYVDDDDAYTQNVADIAADLLSWAKVFFGGHPHLQTRPLYIFCESYGGKMSAAFADVLRTAIKNGDVRANLKGVALGDSWISPVDYTNTWGPYLYAFSLLGNGSLAILNQQARKCENYVNAGSWYEATACWSAMESLVEQNTDGADFYNVLAREAGGQDWVQETSAQKRAFKKHIKSKRQTESLDKFMNTEVRQKLKIIPKNVTWGGTELWLNRLHWPKLSAFHSSSRDVVHSAAGQTALFYKRTSPLSMYWVMRAGHMVPADAPEAAALMIQHVFQNN